VSKNEKRPLQNAPFCSISASDSNFNPRNIQYIPAVKIIAFLDLDQISADFEIEHFSKVSKSKPRMRVGCAGATVRNRTADILITSEVLCQLSYGGSKMNRRQYSCFFRGCPLIYEVKCPNLPAIALAQARRAGSKVQGPVGSGQ
jgi:hypothetical protein